MNEGPRKYLENDWSIVKYHKVYMDSKFMYVL